MCAQTSAKFKPAKYLHNRSAYRNCEILPPQTFPAIRYIIYYLWILYLSIDFVLTLSARTKTTLYNSTYPQSLLFYLHRTLHDICVKQLTVIFHGICVKQLTVISQEVEHNMVKQVIILWELVDLTNFGVFTEWQWQWETGMEWHHMNICYTFLQFSYILPIARPGLTHFIA